MKVAILGASNKEERYAYKAFSRLRKAGHTVFPVNPNLQDIEGVKVYKSLEEIGEPVDTLTVYIGKDRLEPLIDSIISFNPKRIICNPGTENEALIERAKKHNIEVLQACTLVLLSTGQF